MAYTSLGDPLLEVNAPQGFQISNQNGVFTFGPTPETPPETPVIGEPPEKAQRWLTFVGVGLGILVSAVTLIGMLEKHK